MARATWSDYRSSIGDRTPIYRAISDLWPVQRVLYPGSYVDAAPSRVFPHVTYVDTDARAAAYFADEAAVLTDIEADGAEVEARFLQSDYSAPLGLPERDFDLLISLYAGPFWDNCRRYLRPGGLLLANASHGEASLAALDPALTLVGVVPDASGRLRLVTSGLDRFLIPKKPELATDAHIRGTGRGVAYTTPAFAYVFRFDG